MHFTNCTKCDFSITEDHNFVDGTCDKCGATEVVEPEEPIYNASVKIPGKAGLFESDFSLIYYVPKSYPTNWYIKVEKESFSESTPTITTLTEADIYTTQGNYYLVALRGISAKQVANEITATLYAEVNGVMSYGDALDFNLKDYAEDRIAKSTDADLVAAMKAFLNYAAACQTRFNYNTSDLANATLSSEDKVIIPPTEITNENNVKEYIKIDNPTASVAGFAVSYEDKMTLAPILKVPSDYATTGIQVKIEYKGKADYISLKDDSQAYSGSYRIVYFTGLAIKEVREPVIITVIDSNGNAISNSRKYSFESFASDWEDGEKDYNPSRAMVTFGDLFKIYKD